MKRIPRPQGLTQLSQSLSHQNTTNKQTVLNNLIQLILLEYVSNNYTINNKPKTIHQLSAYLKVPLISIVRSIQEISKQWGKVIGVNKDGDYEDFRMALFGLGFFGISEVLSESREQLSTLKSSQGGKYQPFISTTVNQAIQNLMGSHKLSFDMLKLLEQKPNPTTKINILNANSSTQSTAFLTVDKALEIIQSHALNPDKSDLNPSLSQSNPTISLYRDNEGLARIKAEEKDENLPEVIANRQDGLTMGMVMKAETKLSREHRKRQEEMGLAEEMD